MPFPEVPSPLSTILASSTYNAAWFSGSTDEIKITNAIAAAAADGALVVHIPLSMIPYDPTAVTFNPAVKLTREGGNPEHYDIVAYGGRQANGSIVFAMQEAIRAAVANGGGTVDAMTPFGTFVVLDGDPMENLIPLTDITPVTTLWGNYELRYTHRLEQRSHKYHIFHGTRLIAKDASGTRVLGTHLFYDEASRVGLGGPGNGITTTSGSPVVTKTAPTAANWAKLEIGSPVLVLGFVPPLGTDNTTINTGPGIDAVVTTIPVASTTGFPANAAAGGYGRIENELFSYTSEDATNFLGCTRGASGTTAASHANGTRVDRVVYRPFYVTAISGNTFTLDGNMDMNATNLDVWIGSLDVVFDGVADFNGNQDPAVDDAGNPNGIYMSGGRNWYIAPGIVFRNFDHGGFTFNQSQDNVAICRGYSNTKPLSQLGCSFWVFGWSKRNTIDVLEVSDSYVGLGVDDRSTVPTFLNGPSEDSSFRVRVANNMARSNGSGGAGILLEGCRNCNAHIEFFGQIAGSSGAAAVAFGGAGQWVTETATGRKCVGNVITVGVVRGNGTEQDISVTAAADDHNTIILQRRAPVGVLQPSNHLVTPFTSLGLTFPGAGGAITTDASRSEDVSLVVADTTAFPINAPTNPTDGRRLTYRIQNSSGGAMGAITWNAAFKQAGAFTNPANGQARYISYRFSGGFWREENRTAADQIA